MSSEIAIRVENLSKCYHIYDKPRDRLLQFLSRGRKQYYRAFWALKDVSFNIKKGETVGIIGRNGSGKSTLLQLICGTLNPTVGNIHTRGRVAALLELGSGFNPEFTGRENVYLNAALLGLSKEETDMRFEDIAAFADIGDFIDQPVKTFSSGMYVRLAFAVAINVQPDILIVDEALSVGDIRFQNKCIQKIKEIQDSGASILFVSHSPGQIEALCNRAIWLNDGIVKADGQPKFLMRRYANFMTHGIDEEENVPIYHEKASDYAISSKPDTSLWAHIGPKNNVKGNRFVVINRVIVRTMDGRPANRISSISQNIRVTFSLTVKERVCMPLLGIGIFNNFSEPIIHFNNENIGVKITALEPGTEHTFDFIFKLPALRPGEYLISVGVDNGTSGNNTVLCHVYDAWSFIVILPHGIIEQAGYIQIEDKSEAIKHMEL